MRAKNHSTGKCFLASQRTSGNRKKWKISLRRIAMRLGAVFFFGVAAYFMFFSALFHVSAIEIIGTSELNAEKLEQSIKTQLKGEYFKFFKKNNLVLASTESLEAVIRGEFRKIEELEVKKKFPNKLVVSLKERESVIILCGRTCYVADSRGKLYDEIDLDSDKEAINLPILRDGGGKELLLQEAVLDPDYIYFIKIIREKLRSELEIESDRELFTPQLISGDIRVKTKEGWSIYFDKNILLEKEISMLRVVLDKKIEKATRADLEYIDLRMDNKVYYKYKTSAVPREEQQSVDEPKTEKVDGGKKRKKKD